MPSKKHEPRLIVAVVLCVSLASCASVPRATRPAEAYFDMLPPGPTAYLALDLVSTRELVPGVAAQLGLPARELAEGLRRARAVYAGILLREGASPEVSAIVAGEFPPAGVRASLCLLRADWRRVADGEVWHENRGSGMQIAATEPDYLLVSTGHIKDSIAAARHPAAAPVPAAVLALASRNDLLVFLPSLPAGQEAFGAGKAPPVLEMWLTATRAGELTTAGDALSAPLEISLGFRLAGEREARLFRPVLRLLLLGMVRQGRLPGGSEALSTLRDEVEGDVVRLTGLRMTVGEALKTAQGLLGGGGTSGGSSSG